MTCVLVIALESLQQDKGTGTCDMVYTEIFACEVSPMALLIFIFAIVGIALPEVVLTR